MIGEMVRVVVDRPLGTYHPKHADIYYPINYGYIEGLIAPEDATFTKDEIAQQVAFQEQFFRTEIRMG